MEIDDKRIAYLEDLSRLVLSDDERTRLAGDLRDILNGMARLNELNTESAAMCYHPFAIENVFREDEVTASFPRASMLKNAPRHNDEMFIAPKTLG